jgi:hypothetical protein
MLVGVENIHHHFLVAGLEDMQGKEGLREEHDPGQGEEGKKGW